MSYVQDGNSSNSNGNPSGSTGLAGLLNGLGGSPGNTQGPFGSLFSGGNASPTDPYPSAGGGSLASLQASVFLGTKKVYQQYSPTRPSGPGNEGDNTQTIQQMLDNYYGSLATDTKKVLSLGQKLANAGFMNTTAIGDISATGLAYRNMLELSARMYMTGNRITPEDLMAKGAANMQTRPASYSTTTKDINLTDPTQARQMLIQSLQNQLGRNPSPSEYQAFLASLHAAERAHPTVTTRQYKLNSATNSYDVGNSTTSGGMDPSAFTLDYGQNNNTHEHAAYQAATTYYDAMIGALKAVV